MNKIKVAVVVGHTSTGDKGAYSQYIGLSEYDYNLRVAKQLESLSNDSVEYHVYTHTIQGYASRQATLADKLNPLKYDYVFELHFNASTPQANGTECLYYFNSSKGKLASQIISKQITQDFNTTLRGVEGAKALVNSNDRGFGFVYKQKAVAVIIEPFFGSNEEANKFSDVNKYACTLHNAIMKLK